MYSGSRLPGLNDVIQPSQALDRTFNISFFNAAVSQHLSGSM